jgi:serine/threonine protein kinase
MSAQMLGLAKALQMIHDCPIDKDNVQDLSLDERGKPYGRHGDLKPENILWYKSEGSVLSNGPIGTLKIADFGFADFHSEHSRSRVRRSAIGGITDTYKAPEYDVSQMVSPQYDIWSLGCILLQFVVWYIRGWKGVDDFSKRRTEDSRGATIASDIFSGLELGVSRGFRAKAKVSVAEVSNPTISCDVRVANTCGLDV